MTALQDLIKDNSPEAQQLALDLRDLVARLVPQAREKVYKGWGVLDFQLGGKRDFLTIGPQKKYVNLYFMRGTDLPDPAHLLEGTGKNMRHVKIKSAKDLQNKALHTLIKTASKL